MQEYIGLDLANNPIHDNQPDIFWQNGKIPLESDTVDCALLTEVLEHVPNPTEVLTEIFRVLKPNGLLFLTVPFLWPLHEVPYDNYRYTPFSLRRHMEDSGFSLIEMHATGGWDASLAQILGLWVSRGSLGPIKRRLLKIIVFPIYCCLVWLDRKRPIDEFKDSTMVPGLWATALKSSTGLTNEQ